jgi:hypothetical protein
MESGNKLERLERLDHRFVEIYEETRAKVVEQQKEAALIVIDDDGLLLYRRNHPIQRFPGLQPPLYTKMKTLGHIPLAVFCLLCDHTGGRLTAGLLAKISAYRGALESSAEDLDTSEEVQQGILPKPSPVYAKVIAFLDAVIAKGCASGEEIAAFAQSVGEDIAPLLAAAARAQLDACNAMVTHIRQQLLSDEQWHELRVLVLGPYMARQGELFLQYFSQLLDTPMQGDRRLVYFNGDDLQSAFDRLGTTMLDAMASHAIFGDRERLHRDVLADETTRYLRDVATNQRANAESGFGR